MFLETRLWEQECACACYYLSWALSIHQPMLVLCIMHDKMDHSKMASLCFASKKKIVDGYYKLRVSVIGMIAHGHGNKKYAHYALDLYPTHSNCTTGSIARFLRDLERPSRFSNPESLFIGTRTTDLYATILWECEDCITSIPMKHSIQEQFVSLPPILHMQLDNCWKGNKNRWIMYFRSLLIVKGVFEKIQGFIHVGGSHSCWY